MSAETGAACQAPLHIFDIAVERRQALGVKHDGFSGSVRSALNSSALTRRASGQQQHAGASAASSSNNPASMLVLSRRRAQSEAAEGAVVRDFSRTTSTSSWSTIIVIAGQLFSASQGAWQPQGLELSAPPAQPPLDRLLTWAHSYLLRSLDRTCNPLAVHPQPLSSCGGYPAVQLWQRYAP